MGHPAAPGVMAWKSPEIAAHFRGIFGRSLVAQLATKDARQPASVSVSAIPVNRGRT
jgi:hypothetical protein